MSSTPIQRRKEKAKHTPMFFARKAKRGRKYEVYGPTGLYRSDIDTRSFADRIAAEACYAVAAIGYTDLLKACKLLLLVTESPDTRGETVSGHERTLAIACAAAGIDTAGLLSENAAAWASSLKQILSGICILARAAIAKAGEVRS